MYYDNIFDVVFYLIINYIQLLKREDWMCPPLMHPPPSEMTALENSFINLFRERSRVLAKL